MPRDVDRAALHATLDLLLRALAKPGAKALATPAAGAPSPPPDALIAAYQGAKETLRDLGTRDPMDALGAVISTGTVAFYMAEKGKNPNVKDMWDALTYVTTCLSVGYHNIFPVTSAGKAIASFLMTVGPSLAARAFDPPRAEADRAENEAAATQRAVVERLDAILDALRAASPRTTPG
jgi:voltage-gated potassium channel